MREGERLGRAQLHGERFEIPRLEFVLFSAETPFDVTVAAGYVHRLIVGLQQPVHHGYDQSSRHDRAQCQPERDDELRSSRQCGKPLRESVSPTSFIPHDLSVGRSGPACELLHRGDSAQQ